MQNIKNLALTSLTLFLSPVAFASDTVDAAHHARASPPANDLYLGLSLGVETWFRDNYRVPVGVITGKRLSEVWRLHGGLELHSETFLTHARIAFHPTFLPGLGIGPKVGIFYNPVNKYRGWGAGGAVSYDLRMSQHNVIGAELSVMSYGYASVAGTVQWKYFLF